MAIRPEDVIPDGADHANFSGIALRKGSVAAFLANIDLLEDINSTAEQKADALAAMNELAPTLVAVGLHRHVTFKNADAERVLRAALTAD